MPSTSVADLRSLGKQNWKRFGSALRDIVCASDIRAPTGKPGFGAQGRSLQDASYQHMPWQFRHQPRGESHVKPDIAMSKRASWVRCSYWGEGRSSTA